MDNEHKHSSKISSLLWYAIIAACCIVFYLAYNTTIQSLLYRWNRLDEAYGHGYLVLFITAFLCFESKERLKKIKFEPILYAAIPLLIFNLLWFVAVYLDVIIIQQFILPLLMLSFIALLAGRKAFVILLFPILYLYFAIPIWDYLNSTLLDLTARVVSVLVGLVNITVFIEGDTITLPHGQMVIAHGCSGLRYFIICSALSFLSAHQFFTGFKHRILVVTIGVVIGILINWLRVFALVLIGYYTKMESGLIEDHELFGWVLFVILYSPMFFIGYFSNAEPGKETTSNGNETKQSQSQIRIAAVLALILGFSGPILVMAMLNIEKNLSGQTTSIHLDIPSWISIKQKVDNFYFFRSNKKRPTEVFVQGYKDSDAALTLIFAVYNDHGNNSDFLPYRAGHYDPVIWQKMNTQTVHLDTERGRQSVRGIEIKNKLSEQKRLVWYWYVVGNYTNSNPHLAKLSELFSLVTRNYNAAYIHLSQPCELDCDAQSEELAGIISQVYNSTYLALSKNQ